MSETDTVVRAFELARSGRFKELEELRRELKAKRFEAVDQHISGSLALQLRGIINAARRPASDDGAVG